MLGGLLASQEIARALARCIGGGRGGAASQARTGQGWGRTGQRRGDGWWMGAPVEQSQSSGLGRQGIGRPPRSGGAAAAVGRVLRPSRGDCRHGVETRACGSERRIRMRTWAGQAAALACAPAGRMQFQFQPAELQFQFQPARCAPPRTPPHSTAQALVRSRARRTVSPVVHATSGARCDLRPPGHDDRAQSPVERQAGGAHSQLSPTDHHPCSPGDEALYAFLLAGAQRPAVAACRQSEQGLTTSD